MAIKRKLSVAIDEKSLSFIDEFAKKTGLSRSSALDVLIKISGERIEREDALIAELNRVELSLKSRLDSFEILQKKNRSQAQTVADILVKNILFLSMNSPKNELTDKNKVSASKLTEEILTEIFKA